jgi:hypothetical protein
VHPQFIPAFAEDDSMQPDALREQKDGGEAAAQFAYIEHHEHGDGVQGTPTRVAVMRNIYMLGCLQTVTEFRRTLENRLDTSNRS